MPVPGLQAGATGGDLYIYFRASRADVVLFDEAGSPPHAVKVIAILGPGVVISSSLGPRYVGGVQVPGIPSFLIDQFHVDSTFEIIIPSTGILSGPGGEGGRGSNETGILFAGGGGGGGAGVIGGIGGAADPNATAGGPGFLVTGGLHGVSGASIGGANELNFPGADGGDGLVCGAYPVLVKNEGWIAGGGGGGYGASSTTFAFPDGVDGGDLGQDADDFAGAPLTGFAGNAIRGSAVTITGGGTVFGSVGA